MIDTQTYENYIKLGLSCIPCSNKQPYDARTGSTMAWKRYQGTLPTPEDVLAFKGPQIAVVCGSVSGGLTCLDFDVKNGDRFEQWYYIVNGIDPKILTKLVIEKTPSGGYHVLFRSKIKFKSEKLAKNVVGKEMIETKGEHGYFVCAPSPGYEWYFNDFNALQSINTEDAYVLINAAKSLDCTIKDDQEYKLHSNNMHGETPFDDYNSKESPVNLLKKHGWKVLFERKGGVYFSRPGKTKGISATWNAVPNMPNRFYCFTTSTQFESEHVYKASAVYTLLEHNGDYSRSAKELYSKGYGKADKNHGAKLVNVSGVFEKLKHIKKHGYPKGKSTGWDTLDKLFKVAKKQFTVVTGVPSAGKSEFVDALAINLMISNRWKFAVFSPENYPAEMHYHKLVEKLLGGKIQDFSDDDLSAAVNTISENFFFIDALEDDITLDNILDQTKELVEKQNVDVLIIDPWNEIESARPSNVSETDFIGNSLRILRKFARKYDIHLFIVAHPRKLSKDRDGNYPIPELWDISGSAHWRNKADNGICVHRDYEKKCTRILMQKVKFKYFGRQGECELYYRYDSGRYTDIPPVGGL